MPHDDGPDSWPPERDETGNDAPRRRASDGGRGWFGRPLTLAAGWVLSCVLITAVTFTAVEHVGREVSGTQDLLSARGPQPQVTQPPAPSLPATSPSVIPAITQPPIAGSPANTPTPSPRASRSSKAPVVPASLSPVATTPAPTPTATPFVVPANAVEYVFTCQDGKAVGGAVVAPPPSPTPSASPSTSASPSGTTSATPTASPAATGTPSVSPSATPTPTGSPSTSKTLESIKDGSLVIGTIQVTCSGNVVAAARATTAVLNYTLSVRSITDQKVDVFFAKN